MAYKVRADNLLISEGHINTFIQRNPMRSERITALGRKLARLPANFTATFETQWFERT